MSNIQDIIDFINIGGDLYNRGSIQVVRAHDQLDMSRASYEYYTDYQIIVILFSNKEFIYHYESKTKRDKDLTALRIELLRQEVTK